MIAGYPGHDSGWYPPDKYYGDYKGAEDYMSNTNFEQDALLFEQRVKSGNESYFKLFNLKSKLPPDSVLYNLFAKFNSSNPE